MMKAGVSVKAGLWTGLGLDFVLVLLPIAAYSSDHETLVPSRKLTASHRCGIEEAGGYDVIHNFIPHVIEFRIFWYTRT